MSQVCIGFDTSNYTTSAAGLTARQERTRGSFLPSRKEPWACGRGEALFQHVKRLHQMTQALCAQSLPGEVAAVGASTRPREVEGSYMPCFLVGEGQAKTLAAVLGVPFYSCSHQQGHIAAAAWSRWAARTCWTSPIWPGTCREELRSCSMYSRRATR